MLKFYNNQFSVSIEIRKRKRFTAILHKFSNNDSPNQAREDVPGSLRCGRLAAGSDEGCTPWESSGRRRVPHRRGWRSGLTPTSRGVD